MQASSLVGEEFPGRVGASFGDRDGASAAAARLSRLTVLEPDQIEIVEPDDPRMGKKLEPETRGIERTLVKSHVMLGAAGLFAGAGLAILLISTGASAFSASPWYTFMASGFFGAIAGLLLAGLISLRPDHDRLIGWVRNSARRGRWLVLVHARNRHEESEATDMLKSFSDNVVASP